jgi:hypothetical protein
LDEVAAVALGLPETSEVVTWEVERTFRTRNKIFVMGSPGASSISVKTSLEEQRELVATDPRTYSIAAYVGRFGWTRIVLSTVDRDELTELIVEAWRRTAAKKVVAAYDAEH